MRLVIVLLLIAAVATPAAAAPGDIQLLSEFKPAGAVSVTDVWGYVDPVTQIEYAVLGDWTRGFYVIDLSDPINPTVALDYTGQGAPGFDVKTWGTYVYACSGRQSGSSSRAVNIANLAAPVSGALFVTAHNLSVSPQGYIFGSGAGLTCHRLYINPLSPFYLWREGFSSTHDSSPVGNRLYEFRGYFGMFIFDITNPESPVELTNWQDLGVEFFHSGYPSSDGNTLYVCDELAVNPVPDITIWDIRNLNSPVKVGWLADSTATVHNLYVVDDLAFVSYYSAGFRVYDVSSPYSPVMTAEYDTSPTSGEGYGIGCFGVYPFAPSGNVYVSDMDNGLFVFSVETSNTNPVAFARFAARSVPEGVQIDWDVSADEPYDGFRVYRRGENEKALPMHDGLLAPDARGYLDAGVEAGQRYVYSMIVRLPDGSSVASQTATVTVPSTDTRLLGNYPNPFNPSTTIAYELSRAEFVTLDVIDARGMHVTRLAAGRETAGRHEVTWDGSYASGAAAASGVYFARLTAGSQVYSSRLVLVK